MSSRDKRRIARTNGAKSTGPKTPEGLQKSAQNALRHGLTAKSLVLGNESQTKFDELMEAFIRKFQPQDEVELELVTEMVAARWRLRRVWLIQTAAIDLQMDRMAPEIERQFKVITHPTRLSLAFTTLANEEKSLQLLLRYETTYSRAFDRALKTLEKLQKTRPESTTTEELRNEPKIQASTEPRALATGNEICETTQAQQPTPEQKTTNDPNPDPAPIE